MHIFKTKFHPFNIQNNPPCQWHKEWGQSDPRTERNSHYKGISSRCQCRSVFTDYGHYYNVCFKIRSLSIDVDSRGMKIRKYFELWKSDELTNSRWKWYPIDWFTYVNEDRLVYVRETGQPGFVHWDGLAAGVKLHSGCTLCAVLYYTNVTCTNIPDHMFWFTLI